MVGGEVVYLVADIRYATKHTQCTGKTVQQRILLFKMSVGLHLRNVAYTELTTCWYCSKYQLI